MGHTGDWMARACTVTAPSLDLNNKLHVNVKSPQPPSAAPGSPALSASGHSSALELTGQSRGRQGHQETQPGEIFIINQLVGPDRLEIWLIVQPLPDRVVQQKLT